MLVLRQGRCAFLVGCDKERYSASACHSTCNKTHKAAELRPVHSDNMRQRCVREDEGSNSGLESVGGYTGVGEEAGELFNAMAWFSGAFDGACEFGK